MTADTHTDFDFDVIVVGAGIAGSITALELARRGLSVLVAERGAEPGTKNLSGGVFYCQVMDSVIQDFANVAPVERVITRNCLSFLTPEAMVSLDYRDSRLAEPVNAVSVLRAKLDPWLAEQAEQAGAMVMPGVKVDSLLMERGQVVGIEAAGDQMRARVVVAADGVNSYLCQDAGLRPKEPDKHLAVGVKSVVALDRQVIEQRFGVSGNQGAAYAVVGDCTAGVAGGGFIYTNLDSVSIGVVLRLDDLIRQGGNAAELHDRFITHPGVTGLLEGGEVIEYGSHLVAEGGHAMVHDLVFDGLVVVGDAAGLTLNTGLTVRGMDLAAGSAVVAAKAIAEAIKANDTSAAGLSRYTAALGRCFVGQDMDTYAKAPAFFEAPRLYDAYGALATDLFHGIFSLDTKPRRHLLKTARASLKASGVPKRKLLKDGWAGIRGL
ncbi:MAG: FAD-dependent oxidoreductase [Micrococcales bacterium]|nr:FAD-dependent oxidoreductase [Micrococcales bacterium]